MKSQRLYGYAAIFDVPDRGGDVVRKGAFAKAPPSGFPLLMQHNPAVRIGTVTGLCEDEKGLRIEAYTTEDCRVEIGTGLSFGYRASRWETIGDQRHLIELELIEISIVTHPMQPLAVVDTVRDFTIPV